MFCRSFIYRSICTLCLAAPRLPHNTLVVNYQRQVQGVQLSSYCQKIEGHVDRASRQLVVSSMTALVAWFLLLIDCAM